MVASCNGGTIPGKDSKNPCSPLLRSDQMELDVNLVNNEKKTLYWKQKLRLLETFHKKLKQSGTQLHQDLSFDNFRDILDRDDGEFKIHHKLSIDNLCTTGSGRQQIRLSASLEDNCIIRDLGRDNYHSSSSEFIQRFRILLIVKNHELLIKRPPVELETVMEKPTYMSQEIVQNMDKECQNQKEFQSNSQFLDIEENDFAISK
ncbi:unnamed protein product [Lepeophtheirus salmonis]|uniref:(salmon louse) hypothetical protein n=1 Tax=Lepeophtheirus salmonis TaxID=72036 RepID=A0A7R8CEM8_LEPSM|nr:unnamed protein product [Lepeophtheirus salmonis]CAF2797503.1 unnamed protein product [Lepeophtheirus salmonis]